MTYVCPHCIHPFTTQNAFARYFSECSKHHERQHLKFPSKQNDKLFWKSRAKTQLYQFVLNCDFEAILVPVESEKLAGAMHVVSEHVPFSFCLYTVCNFKDEGDSDFTRYMQLKPVLNLGPNTIDSFYNYLNSEWKRISCKMGRNAANNVTTISHRAGSLQSDYTVLSL